MLQSLGAVAVAVILPLVLICDLYSSHVNRCRTLNLKLVITASGYATTVHRRVYKHDLTQLLSLSLPPLLSLSFSLKLLAGVAAGRTTTTTCMWEPLWTMHGRARARTSTPSSLSEYLRLSSVENLPHANKR